MNQELIDELEAIKIKKGDIIVDHMSGYVGVVLNRTRRIDIVVDDVYFWEIKWTTRFTDKKSRKKPNPFEINGFLEEETLKLSILVGAVEIFTSDDNE